MQNREESFAKFYQQLGYSDIDLYNEWDENLMEFEGESEYIKKFNLKKSDINVIIKVLTTSAAHHRSSQKSMMSPRNNTIIPPADFEKVRKVFEDSESLIQTRQNHMTEVAEIAGIIATGLGLNADFAYLTGLGHDIGHTGYGHSGERIMSSIARLKNCGYIVHNAMGAYIIERENLIETAIEQVKQFNPKADEKEIKTFMKYVIDGIVSHNGEGVIGKIIPKDKTTEDMIEEIRSCFTEKGYDKKILPATLEGAIIRFADIIAYTRSDILDGFRMKNENGEKILSEFDDDYLSIIGTVLAREKNYNKLLTLDYKFSLELYGLSKKIDELNKQIEQEGTPELRTELERTIKEREMIQAKYGEFCEYKAKYAQDYIDNIEDKSQIKTKVTDMMQNVFIKDLIESSKGKNYITMSPLMRKTFFALRDLNVRKIVPFTRRSFEIEQLPMAVKGLVDVCSEALLKTGIAYETIPEEKRTDINTRYDKNSYQEEISKVEEGGKKSRLERKMIHYYTRLTQEKRNELYVNALNAIKDITKHDIAIALEQEKYEADLKETYEMEKIMPIKQRIGEMGKTAATITSEDIEKLSEELIKERKRDIETIVANKLAIEYIGGMTDNTIISYLLSKNMLTVNQIIEGYGRPITGAGNKDQGLINLQKAFKQIDGMILPDDIPEDEITL